MKEGDAFADAIHAVADKVESEHGITVRNMNKRDLEAEIGRFMEVYNSAWEKNWGFVPITDEEVAFQAKNLKQILDPRWAFMAERDGEILGAALSLPDINQVTKKMNGRLLPFGWLRFLLGKRNIDRVRVFALGVKPEYQHTGIAARFYVRHIETAAEVGVTGGEEGWILEVNEPMNRAMEGMGGTIVKRYRLYEKSLAATRPLHHGAEGEARSDCGAAARGRDLMRVRRSRPAGLGRARAHPWRFPPDPARRRARRRAPSRVHAERGSSDADHDRAVDTAPCIPALPVRRRPRRAPALPRRVRPAPDRGSSQPSG